MFIMLKYFAELDSQASMEAWLKLSNLLWVSLYPPDVNCFDIKDADAIAKIDIIAEPIIYRTAERHLSKDKNAPVTCKDNEY